MAIGVLLAAVGCERASSDCTKLWDADEALREFGHREACKKTGSCPPRDKAGERKRFLEQCDRWPTGLARCMAQDEPREPKCQAILDSCELDPACKKAVGW